MNVPNQLFYTKDHEWVEFDQDKITIGITDYAQSQLGDIIFVEMPLAGDIFTAGNTFGEIEAVKTVSELYAPLSGTVIEVNDCIEKEPEFVNTDPYGKGWLIKLKCSNQLEKSSLLSSSEYGKLIS